MIPKQNWLSAGATALAMIAALGTAQAADKVVTIWHTEPNEATKGAMAEIIADFEKANPGIKVNQEAIGWGDLDKKMQTALATGALPDAVHGQTYVERSLSAKGLLRPLDDVVASIGEDDIYDVVKKLDYNPKDGHYYGLAHAIGTDVTVYRKDFYREAGLPVDQPPKTWAEWLDQLKKLTVDTDGDGFVDGTSGAVAKARYPTGFDVDGDGFVDAEASYGTGPADPEDRPGRPGDVAPWTRPDGEVDAADAALLLRVVADPSKLDELLVPDARTLTERAADADGDSQITGADAVGVLREAAERD